VGDDRVGGKKKIGALGLKASRDAREGRAEYGRGRKSNQGAEKGGGGREGTAINQ